VTPLEFLREEVDNVRRALNETLRHDYGPGQGREYYIECDDRLAEIKKTVALTLASDRSTIQTLFNELRQLASWILLIERSHLGEFSWPFADQLKDMAVALLSETNLRGDVVKPLIHVVAEAEGYQIQYETQTATVSSRHPFVVIAFQRSLKNHALFHCLFGHELGHTALQTSAAGSVLNSEVIAAFASTGPLSTTAELNKWAKAPSGTDIADEYRESWLEELSCDLFGLVLFGPAFLAAHRTYLSPLDPDPYYIYFSDPTHPSYAVRHKMLRRAMELLGWHTTITNDAFEQEFLNYLLHDPFRSEFLVLDDAQLTRAIAGIHQVIRPLGALAYSPIPAEELRELVFMLARQIPPVRAQINPDGGVSLGEINVAQTLYAGWAYWIGRDKLSDPAPLNFFQTNRLCDLALLQQRAVNDTRRAGVI
jgi:hypothetical protein